MAELINLHQADKWRNKCRDELTKLAEDLNKGKSAFPSDEHNQFARLVNATFSLLAMLEEVMHNNRDGRGSAITVIRPK